MSVPALVFALTCLIATATAAPSGSGDREAVDSTDRQARGWLSPSPDREASGTTDREAAASKSSKSSKLFEKLGFCNFRTLKGRYLFADDGFADVSGVYVGPTISPEDRALEVGPVARSGSVFYGTGSDPVLGPEVQSFRRIVSRTDKFGGSLGPPTVFKIWSNVWVDKNCTTVEQGIAVQFTSPLDLIIDAEFLFLEGNAAPDGSDVVFTEFEETRINAFSGDIKRVAEFALPPREFIEGPPDIPTSCGAAQSCRSRYEARSCNTDRDCRIFCSPFCGMVCAGIGARKECLSLTPKENDDK